MFITVGFRRKREYFFLDFQAVYQSATNSQRVKPSICKPISTNLYYIHFIELQYKHSRVKYLLLASLRHVPVTINYKSPYPLRLNVRLSIMK